MRAFTARADLSRPCLGEPKVQNSILQLLPCLSGAVLSSKEHALPNLGLIRLPDSRVCLSYARPDDRSRRVDVSGREQYSRRPEWRKVRCLRHAWRTRCGKHPGGRSGSSNWTESMGDLWLFVGDGFGANGLNYELNDVWNIRFPRFCPRPLSSHTPRIVAMPPGIAHGLKFSQRGMWSRSGVFLWAFLLSLT